MTHADDVTWMERAIELSRKCPPAEGAFSVGAIIVGADGEELAHGYSRETDAHVHAEESALAKLPTDDPRLAGATLYSTLEPCSERKSRPLTCTQLILRSPSAAWSSPGASQASWWPTAWEWKPSKPTVSRSWSYRIWPAERARRIPTCWGK